MSDMGFGPDEGLGGFVVGGDKIVDAASHLGWTCEAFAGEGVTAEDGKPDFDLVHPGGVGGREVETHIGMTGKPQIALGFMGGQVVEHDVELAIGIGGNQWFMKSRNSTRRRRR